MNRTVQDRPGYGIQRCPEFPGFEFSCFKKNKNLEPQLRVRIIHVSTFSRVQNSRFHCISDMLLDQRDAVFYLHF